MFCGGEEQPVPGDATFNKEGDGQKLLAPAVQLNLIVPPFLSIAITFDTNSDKL